MDEIKLFDSRKDKISAFEINKLMKNVDNDFFPPLCERPEFVSYNYQAKRFLNNGIVFFCRQIKTNKIIAFTVLYADPNKYKYAYWSYLVVEKEYRKLGIATALIKKVIDTCKEIGMKGIQGSCAIENKRMMNLLKINGFERINDEKIIQELKNATPKDNREKAFYLKYIEHHR